MDLLSVLSQASRSLSAHQSAAATASHNIQNVNTPGYARQRAQLQTVTPAMAATGAWIGRGVELSGVYQVRDRFIEAQIPVAIGAQGRSSAEAEALRAVSALDPDSTGNLSSSLGDFYSSLRTLSVNAGDPVLRQGAVDAARNLASAFNRTSTSLRDARAGMDQKLSALAGEASAAAESIASLNVQILSARATGGEPNNLVDQRHRAMDTLARLTGATPVLDSQGSVSMNLPGGTALVSGSKAARLTTMPDVNNEGHSRIQIIKPDGNGPFDLSVDKLGGAMGGSLDARDGALADAISRVDQLAWDFGNAINGVHRGGHALDGSPGRDLFVLGAGAPGAAANISLDALIDGDPSLLAGSSDAGGVPGNADVFFALVDTERQALASGADPFRTLASITGDFGSRTARAGTVAKSDGAILANLEKMRESVSGVSVDDELIELAKAQRAYEAVAKVLVTTDEMLETLMSLR